MDVDVGAHLDLEALMRLVDAIDVDVIAEMIDVTKDRRVPMAEIQKLFAGKLKPEDVLKAADAIDESTEAGKEARFYANLYVALWYESEKQTKKRDEHLKAAVEKYKIGHYMWDVAKAHRNQLK